MEQSGVQRKLAAILSADMVGYSRLMEADETGTIARQKAHFDELVDPTIRRQHGRIVKLMGDGLLAEFASVVDAVRCAVTIQRAMVEREADLPEDRRIRYRIGVNLGDIVIDGNDILGDGVNVAARLQELAEPGRVYVSGTAYDQLKQTVDVGYENLGERQVKNIATPVRVYRVLLDPKAAGKVIDQQPVVRASWQRPAAIATTVALLAMVGGIFGIWYAGWLMPTAQDTASIDPVLSLPTGPKIVVLPFENLSGDADQDYFVVGLTEDLTNRLSQYTYLFVIARKSASKYKGKAVDVREAGSDLGVDYVLEGSVRRSGGSIRMSAQLLDAKNGTHVWAETYDRALDVEGVFDIQDELSVSVAEAIGGFGGAIKQPILQRLKDKRPSELASFECVLVAWYWWETYRPDIHQRAKECLKTVVATEPHYAEAWAALSSMYFAEFAFSVNMLPDPLPRAEQAARRSIEEDPNLARGHLTMALTQFFLRNKEESLLALERAIGLAPHEGMNLSVASSYMMRLGFWDRSKALIDKALKLNPNPQADYYFPHLYWHYRRGEYEQALEQILKVKQNLAGLYSVHTWEAIILAEIGRIDEAKAALDRGLALRSDYPATARAVQELWWWPQPDFIEQIINSLQKAGLNISEQQTPPN